LISLYNLLILLSVADFDFSGFMGDLAGMVSVTRANPLAKNESIRGSCGPVSAT
jgi:hypothetical protein